MKIFNSVGFTSKMKQLPTGKDVIVQLPGVSELFTNIKSLCLKEYKQTCFPMKALPLKLALSQFFPLFVGGFGLLVYHGQESYEGCAEGALLQQTGAVYVCRRKNLPSTSLLSVSFFCLEFIVLPISIYASTNKSQRCFGWPQKTMKTVRVLGNDDSSGYPMKYSEGKKNHFQNRSKQVLLSHNLKRSRCRQLTSADHSSHTD